MSGAVCTTEDKIKGIEEVQQTQIKTKTDKLPRRDDSSTISDDADDHFIVVAIDFGSRYSGYMYSFKSEFEKDPSKIIGKHWRYGSCDLVTAKTDTSVLLDSDQFVAFGYEAEEKYANKVTESICSEDRMPDDLFLFRNFKMQLYERERIQRTFKLRNDRGQRISAMKVFSKAIAYLKNDAMKFLKEKAEISERDVLWVITVPAIWSGTVDVTVYEVQKDDTLNEIHAASGGAWGGENVNKAFMNIWQSILGKEKYKKFLTDYQDDVIFFRNGFESLKRQTNLHEGNENNRNYILLMPEYFKEEIGIESLKSELKEKHGDNIKIGRGKIFLSPKFLMELFQETIKSITEHVRGIFSRVNDVSRVIMVGGFSEAGVLKDKLKEEFPDKRFFIPDECNSAIMKGAVMYGFKNSYIGRRISRYSYGVNYRTVFDPEIHHPMQRSIVDGKQMCENVFKAFVHAGDNLVPGETRVKHTFRATTNPAIVELYASMNRNPVYITDACHIGDVEIYLQQFKHEREVEVTMHFGNTEINVSVVDTKTGQLEQSSIELLK
ncbi:hypothetical protein KUTeg_008876 [Tegillarca granosa]|uniref:Heat shock 70 kDa protein 12A n=1 Tax=Tegillarca granosa TaxID=220873 RepID=A0ABQ9FAF9_TEGGR|nr:hypothetical protein KUTeg_008876 [Tegillarca granosa]